MNTEVGKRYLYKRNMVINGLTSVHEEIVEVIEDDGEGLGIAITDGGESVEIYTRFLHYLEPELSYIESSEAVERLMNGEIVLMDLSKSQKPYLNKYSFNKFQGICIKNNSGDFVKSALTVNEFLLGKWCIVE